MRSSINRAYFQIARHWNSPLISAPYLKCKAGVPHNRIQPLIGAGNTRVRRVLGQMVVGLKKTQIRRGQQHLQIPAPAAAAAAAEDGHFMHVIKRGPTFLSAHKVERAKEFQGRGGGDGDAE